MVWVMGIGINRFMSEYQSAEAYAYDEKSYFELYKHFLNVVCTLLKGALMINSIQ